MGVQDRRRERDRDETFSGTAANPIAEVLSPGERESLMSVEGIVFDVQRYSLHDGPGLRTNIFLKGCPLRCGWCSNPESQRLQPELALFEQHCIACGQFDEPCSHCWSGTNGRELSRELAGDYDDISTAIETSGHPQWDVFERLLPFLDHILFHVKHLDGEMHRAYTGNERDVSRECLSRIAHFPIRDGHD